MSEKITNEELGARVSESLAKAIIGNAVFAEILMDVHLHIVEHTIERLRQDGDIRDSLEIISSEEELQTFITESTSKVDEFLRSEREDLNIKLKLNNTSETKQEAVPVKQSDEVREYGFAVAYVS